MVAISSMRPIRNGVPGPYQRPFVSATTFPFRVRGTQVQVRRWQPPAASPSVGSYHVLLPLTLNLSIGAPAAVLLADAPALVYRIQPGQLGVPLANAAGQPFQTDAQGYLQGRGEIATGDQLVALQPIAATKTYTAYLTSAAPNAIGLDAFTVTASGVQTLTVSADNPLVLFNLKVALEWDARADPTFEQELTFDLQRASELLYDWTDGQAALGQVRVYQAKGHWDDADIRLFASNRVRPNSTLGGIAAPGDQVRIGAVWNRFGDPSGNQGQDWPRALAHELGHYAFFLDDNYLGLDPSGRVIAVDTCAGAMSDPYRDDQSEFRPRPDWLPACKDTLAEQTTGRADWDTLTGAYPWLHAPPTFNAKPGPSTLPLAVTQVRFEGPSDSRAPLALPLFNLTLDGARLVPSDRARAVLFRQTGDQVTDLVDLGRPVLDQVLARGARMGDRVCVYDLGALDAQGSPVSRLGCKAIQSGGTQLALAERRDWRPEVRVAVGPDRTLTVAVPQASVGMPAPQQFQARLFPTDLTQAPRQLALTLQADGWYRGTFSADQPLAFEGYVQVWVENDGTNGRELVTDYTLGGNPAPPRRPPRRARRRAPVISTDGQVILYGTDVAFDAGEFYAIQTATSLPPPPPWASVVGQGYRLLASSDALLARNLSLDLSHAEGDVARGTEDGVSVYYWPDAPPFQWTRLPTERGAERGEVTAPVLGRGLYVLMSSAEIPLKTGLNLVAYPIPGARPVQAALASIEGAYTTVRGYDPATGQWLMYTAGAPDYANTLKVLAYGKGYEIRTTRNVLLLLRGSEEQPATTAARVLTQPHAFPPAPATYYGIVQGGATFAPAANQTVTAFVDGQVCGRGTTQIVGGQVVYRIDVAADGSAAPGCGAPGKTVTFAIAGHPTAPPTRWENDRAQGLALAVQ